MSQAGYLQHQEPIHHHPNHLKPPSHQEFGTADLTPVSTRSTNDPFRDPSFDYSRSSMESRQPVAEEVQPNRPNLPSRPSEVVRQLGSAMDEELPRAVSPANVQPVNPSGIESTYTPNHTRQVSMSSSKSKTSGSPSLMEQFRTGSGWFAPVVTPEKPLTREEKEAAEKQRIEKLRIEGKGERRPGLLKRASSGVEMLGFSLLGGKTSPTKTGGMQSPVTEDG